MKKMPRADSSGNDQRSKRAFALERCQEGKRLGESRTMKEIYQFVLMEKELKAS